MREPQFIAWHEIAKSPLNVLVARREYVTNISFIQLLVRP